MEHDIVPEATVSKVLKLDGSWTPAIDNGRTMPSIWMKTTPEDIQSNVDTDQLQEDDKEIDWAKTQVVEAQHPGNSSLRK